jgi:two-component system sensor histidine kinase YesM
MNTAIKEWQPMNKQWFKRSLYIRILMILVVLGLIPLMVVSVVGYRSFSNLMVEMIAESNLQTLNQVQNKLEQVDSAIDDILLKTSVNPNIQEMITSKPDKGWDAYQESRLFVDYTQLLMIGNPEIDNITVLNFEGKRIDSRGRFLPDTNIAVPPIYNQIMDDLAAGNSSKSISPIYRASRFDVISFGQLILDLRTGNPIGVIIVDVNLGMMNKGLKSVNLLQSGTIILVDQSGQVIYHPEQNTGTSFQQTWSDFSGSKQYVLEKTEKGNQMLYLKTEITDLGWVLYGMVPYEEVIKRMVDFRYKFYIFLVFMITAIGIVAISMRRVFVIPILKLQRLMRSVESGDFKVRSSFKRNDEIGQLGMSFNQMVKQIQELIEQVYEVRINESRALYYQKQAELEALQSHITPHFLYNTLHSISWFANRKGIREIQSVVDSLSSILQYSVQTTPKMVRLKDEFEYLKLYLDIIDFRYGGTIEFSYELPKEVQNVVLPRLSLQPIVENAIKHAFNGTKEKKKISIITVRNSDDVIVQVEDSGSGIKEEELTRINCILSTPERENELKSDHKGLNGIGLINVHYRLQMWFGKEYGVKITSSEGQGTTVQIKIPAEYKATELLK